MTKTPATPGDFDGAAEPMRALRDLISACEAVFGADNGEDQLLARAQAGFTTLRRLFGDTRTGEEIAFAETSEPGEWAIPTVEALELAAGALQCVAKLLPGGESHTVTFTGQWSGYAPRTLQDILDHADAALEMTRTPACPAKPEGQSREPAQICAGEFGPSFAGAPAMPEASDALLEAQLRAVATEMRR